MHTLPRLPWVRFGVFTATEAYAVGWTPDAVERAVRSGRLVRLRRGVYAAVGGESDDVHPAERARRHRTRHSIAAALVKTRSTVTGLSSATVYGLPVWAPHERACLTVRSSATTTVQGIHLHRGGIRVAARTAVAGFEISRPTRTVVDIAREFGTESGLVAADGAMAVGLTSPRQLRDEIDRLVGRRGVERARPLPDLVSALSESVLESRSRWQFVVHDLPMPQPQTWLYDLDGYLLGRTDFYWDEGLVGEVDGAEKLTDPEARAAYLRRHHALDRVRLRVTRWTVRDLARFDPTARLIRDQLRTARADPWPRLWVASPRRLGAETARQAAQAAVSTPSRRVRGWSEVLEGLTAGEG